MNGVVQASSRFGGVARETASRLLRFRAGSVFLSAPERRGFALQLLGEWGKNLMSLLDLEVEVTGWPPSVPSLMIGNHRSYLDIPVLVSVRPCLFLAKHEIAAWPLFGAAARAGGMIFVKRGVAEDRRRAVDELAARLQGGSSVVVFAEGTTTPGPGVTPFKLGSFRLAHEIGARVATFAVVYDDPELAWVGDDTFLGHFGRSWETPRRRRVRLAFGPSLRPRDFGSPEALRDAAHATVAALTLQLEGRECLAA